MKTDSRKLTVALLVAVLVLGAGFLVLSSRNSGSPQRDAELRACANAALERGESVVACASN